MAFPIYLELKKKKALYWSVQNLIFLFIWPSWTLCHECGGILKRLQKIHECLTVQFYLLLSPQWDARTWKFVSAPQETPLWWSFCVPTLTPSLRATSWATAAACSPSSSFSCLRTGNRMRLSLVRKSADMCLPRWGTDCYDAHVNFIFSFPVMAKRERWCLTAQRINTPVCCSSNVRCWAKVPYRRPTHSKEWGQKAVHR